MTEPTSNSMPLILVDGATGYLGNHLVSRLVEEGFAVRCLVHPGSSAEDREYLRGLTDDIVEVDFSGSKGGIRAGIFESVDCMVHLIGSIAPRKGETLTELHRDITRMLVEAGSKEGLSRIVHVTALGTSDSAASQYHRSKWQAEEVVRKSGIAHMILRPSLILGRQHGRRDSKLVKRLFEFVNKKPFVPLVNGGENKLQPIFVGDVVAAIIAAIRSKSEETVIELGGSQVLKMKELVDMLASRSNKTARIFSMPPSLAKGIASVVEKVQDVPVLSGDQVVLSLSDNICLDNGFETLVGRPPLELEKAIETYDDRYIGSL